MHTCQLVLSVCQRPSCCCDCVGNCGVDRWVKWFAAGMRSVLWSCVDDGMCIRVWVWVQGSAGVCYPTRFGIHLHAFCYGTTSHCAVRPQANEQCCWTCMGSCGTWHSGRLQLAIHPWLPAALPCCSCCCCAFHLLSPGTSMLASRRRRRRQDYYPLMTHCMHSNLTCDMCGGGVAWDEVCGGPVCPDQCLMRGARLWCACDCTGQEQSTPAAVEQLLAEGLFVQSMELWLPCSRAQQRISSAHPLHTSVRQRFISRWRNSCRQLIAWLRGSVKRHKFVRSLVCSSYTGPQWRQEVVFCACLSTFWLHNTYDMTAPPPALP